MAWAQPVAVRIRMPKKSRRPQKLTDFPAGQEIANVLMAAETVDELADALTPELAEPEATPDRHP